MKLFIDDLRQPPDGWQVARTNTEAIRILATVNVEEVSLDHDIMVDVRNYDNEPLVQTVGQETFMPVAYYLALLVKYSIWTHDFQRDVPRIRFHTGNIAMGEKMAKIIGVDFDWWDSAPPPVTS